MKKFTITNAREATETGENENKWLSKFEVEGPEEMECFDGYHTFGELYDHRIELWITVCRGINYRNAVFKSQGTIMNGDNGVWRSKLHDDGSEYEGWFILGIGKEKGKIMTYHLPNIKWDEVSFAETLEKAPEFDGHTPADVITRLKNL